MSDQTDRAAGAILGGACGDALRSPDGWTGRTATAVPILQAAAAGESLTHEATQDEIVRKWLEWSRDAADIGAQTGDVFRGMREASAHAARTSARALHERTGRTAGAGSLVRTAPVALPFITNSADIGLVRAAARISALTHPDPDAVDACVLWAAAIRHAIRTGDADVRIGVPLLAPERRERWTERIADAEAQRPAGLARSGWVVHVFQAAWSAVATTPVPEEQPARQLRLALDVAERAGGSTVAAVAGALLGARWGASAIPAARRRTLHGPPGLRESDLARLAVLAGNGGLGDGTGWPAIDRVRAPGAAVLVRHPHDADVLLGSLPALADLPPDVDAVVSLCRTGRRQTDREQIGFRLVDQDGRNPNLDLVLADAADTVAALRAEGKRVFLHCAEGRSRTPAVGALYAALHLDVPVARALDEVAAALPDPALQPFLREAVLRLGGVAAAPIVVRPVAPAPEPVASPPPAPIAAPARPVLHVDLDTAMLDLASGVARLPPRAQEEHAADPWAAPGVVALMDPLDGAVAAFDLLAGEYDVHLVAEPPWDDPAAAQQRLDWVKRHFGGAPTVAGGPNPAWRRLLFAHPRHLAADATLVTGPGAVPEGFRGRVVVLGTAEAPDWGALLDLLTAPDASSVPEQTVSEAPAPLPVRAAPRLLLADLSRRQARSASRPAAGFLAAQVGEQDAAARS